MQGAHTLLGKTDKTRYKDTCHEEKKSMARGLETTSVRSQSTIQMEWLSKASPRSGNAAGRGQEGRGKSYEY